MILWSDRCLIEMLKVMLRGQIQIFIFYPLFIQRDGFIELQGTHILKIYCWEHREALT